MKSARLAAVLATALLAFGCDGDSPGDTDGGMTDGSVGDDGGGMTGACAGEADGTDCGSSMICIDEVCSESSCGDGFVDDAGGEECDDGNDVAFDGCEPGTCTFTCGEDAECDDGRPCNGAETCTDHVCAAAMPADDGTACTRDGGGDGVCRTGACVDPGCGNGVLDGDEECDDGNDVDDDGCDVDCTFSCEEDLDCADGDTCNGDEHCDTDTHACVTGDPLDCSDGDDCTADECDPIEGCRNPLIDMDGDGHASDTLGACGDDCDDTRDDIFTGAEERCDGVDNNCNTDVDEVAPTWYIDCDEDGYAETTDGSRTGCTEPASSATGCDGRWTNIRPVNVASTDCNDGNADVFPGQTMYFDVPIPGEPGNYDYDCDGTQLRRYGCTGTDGSCGPRCSGGYLPSDSDNPNGCQFICIIGGSCSVRRYPECGQTADYRSCTNSTFGCISPIMPGTLRQACR